MMHDVERHRAFAPVLLAAMLLLACSNDERLSTPSTLEIKATARVAPVSETPCDKVAARDAALHLLPDDLHLYGIEDNISEVIAHRGRIGELRRWANSLPDRCAARAYLYWLDYYDARVNEAERELRLVSQREAERSAKEREEAAKEQRRDDFIEKAKFPAPPRKLR